VHSKRIIPIEVKSGKSAYPCILRHALDWMTQHSFIGGIDPGENLPHSF